MDRVLKRMAIYVFYDRDGKADRYIFRFLNELLKNIDGLIIVCNGYTNDDSILKFKKLTDKVFVRENEGLDLAAYQYALLKTGWTRLAEYDEVILVNDTIMGPVYPFSEMFHTMDTKELDFWGITKHSKSDLNPFGCEYGYTPDHIQSYFMAFRKSLLISKEFQDYWNDIPVYSDYQEVVGKHEISFTKRFSDLGFRWDVYVKTDDMMQRHNQPILAYPKEIIEQKRCPVFKKRVFFQDYGWVLTNSIGTAAVELIEYLQKTGKYDIELIMENILRVCRLPDLVENLHWNYILPARNILKKETDDIKEEKIALLMHVYYIDLFEETLSYAANMPLSSHLYFFTDTELKRQKIIRATIQLPHSKIEVKVTNNRGRDISSLLIGAKEIVSEYKYVCFAHDKKSSHVYPQLESEGFAQKCFENVLFSRDYIINILDLFESNPRLGIAFPPMVNHGSFYQLIGGEWGNNFDNVVSLADKLDIKVKIDKEGIMAPLGDYFWFRPQALNPILKYNWTWEEMPEEPVGIDGSILHAIERIYAYAAQQSGYYAAYIQTDECARGEYTNLSHYVRGFNKALYRGNCFGYYHEMKAAVEELAQKNPDYTHVDELKAKLDNLLREKNNYKEYVDQLENTVQEYGKHLSLGYRIKAFIERINK